MKEQVFTLHPDNAMLKTIADLGGPFLGKLEEKSGVVNYVITSVKLNRGGVVYSASYTSEFVKAYKKAMAHDSTKEEAEKLHESAMKLMRSVVEERGAELLKQAESIRETEGAAGIAEMKKLIAEQAG